MNRKKLVKDIEIILGIILVIAVLKYIFVADILNWIAGYTVYNSDCSLRIANMDEMTVGGVCVPELCDNTRMLILGGITAIVVFMILIYALNKYFEGKKVKK